MGFKVSTMCKRLKKRGRKKKENLRKLNKLKEEIGQIINKPKMSPHLVLKLLKFTHTRNKICLEKFCYWCFQSSFLEDCFWEARKFFY